MKIWSNDFNQVMSIPKHRLLGWWQHHILSVHNWVIDRVISLTYSIVVTCLYINQHMYLPLGRKAKWTLQNKNSIVHRYISTTDDIQHNNFEDHPEKRESTTHKYYVYFVDKCLTLSIRDQYINMTCCP